MTAWRRTGWKLHNADLWKRLDALLSQRAVNSIRMTKVKGHAKWKDVQRGVISQANRFGNHQADKLAVAGVAQHMPAEEE
eukprot:10137515-Karenia_brevis.AAC.1